MGIKWSNTIPVPPSFKHASGYLPYVHVANKRFTLLFLYSLAPGPSSSSNKNVGESACVHDLTHNGQEDCQSAILKDSFTWTPRCTLNAHPIWFVMFTWIHLKSDAHRMRIQTGLYYYSWFTWGYGYHEILLVGLACGTCYIAFFCSALVAMLGKRLLSGREEWYSVVK